MTVSVIVTAISLTIWGVLLLKVQKGTDLETDLSIWYIAASISFSVVFMCQGLSVALFVASYTTIKKAAQTLGLKTSEN